MLVSQVVQVIRSIASVSRLSSFLEFLWSSEIRLEIRIRCIHQTSCSTPLWHFPIVPMWIWTGWTGPTSPPVCSESSRYLPQSLFLLQRSSSSHLEMEPLLLVGTQVAQLCQLFQEEQEDFTVGLLLLKRLEIHLISEGWVAPLKMRVQALPALDRATKEHGKNLPGKIEYTLNFPGKYPI